MPARDFEELAGKARSLATRHSTQCCTNHDGSERTTGGGESTATDGDGELIGTGGKAVAVRAGTPCGCGIARALLPVPWGPGFLSFGRKWSYVEGDH